MEQEYYSDLEESSGGGRIQKLGRRKYSAPNINVYVLMIHNLFTEKWGALAPHSPHILPPMESDWGGVRLLCRKYPEGVTKT